MNVFASLGIILLAMLIQGFLQLNPAIFSIYYHHALGKTSAKKADDRSLSFILGVEIATAIFFLVTYFVISFFVLENGPINNIVLFILSGILFIEAIFMFFFYFKIGKKHRADTELFLPRSLAKNLTKKAVTAKNRTDTITLGFITTTLELVFTLPLFVIASNEIINISSRVGFLFIIADIVIATIPLFTIRTLFHTDHNLAEITRLRVKRKTFFRIILSFSYLSIAILSLLEGLNIW